ncbi:MAG: hypothetical protein H6716_27020 [Polyangiaceae bacterium]|nr:hypothetical protein [Polyangiaceae bacterium]MCB9610269.1 hypothetical protein [Polyangiaceae bacterium]
MKNAHNAMRTTVVSLLALLAILAAGCQPDAVFRVVHPAMVPTADYGNAYSMGTFDGVNPGSAAAYRQLVTQHIQQSVNPAIHLSSGDGLVISASVSDDTFEVTSRRQDASCNCAYENGVVNGQRQYIYRGTPCILLVTEARGRSTVTFRVTDPRTSMDIVSHTFTSADDWRESALTAPNCQNVPPNDQYRAQSAPPIGRQVMADLYRSNAADFARVILPWSEEVEVDLEDCDGDARCRAARERLRNQDLEGALRLYDEVLAAYTDPAAPVSEDDLERVSEALYNRGVVRGYSSDFIGAQLDLERACQMNPRESGWREEFDRIRALATSHEELTRQVSGTPTQ